MIKDMIKMWVLLGITVFLVACGNTSTESRLEKIRQEAKIAAAEWDLLSYLETNSDEELLTALHETPELFFKNTAQMEELIYQSVLIEQLDTEGYIQYLTQQSTNITRGEAEEIARMEVELKTIAGKLAADVLEGRCEYSEEDSEFLKRYEEYLLMRSDSVYKLTEYRETYIDSTAQATKDFSLGTFEEVAGPAGYVFQKYIKVESLDTGMTWKKIEMREDIKPEKANPSNPSLQDVEYQGMWKNLGELPLLAKAFDEDGCSVYLDWSYGNTNAEVEEFLFYYDDQKDVADYYVDVMVRYFQIVYNHFGVTEDLREKMELAIYEFITNGSQNDYSLYASEDNQFYISIGAQTISIECAY